jgi:predicted ribosome quality control (RQC) complex YloA/Tae2 family protein
MSRQISSFEVMRLVKELEILEGGFLQKVYQPREGLLVLRFNTKAGKRYLVHGVGRWLFLAEDMDIDLEPVMGLKGADLPPFVKLLRKHLSNGYVTSSKQLSFDRILELGVRKELPYVLVFEMFGNGNVILTRQGTIVGCLKVQTWRHRTIKGGQAYKPPPQRKDPRTIELSELATLLGQSKADLVRTLATSVNLGGTYAEEVCHRAGLERSTPMSELGIDQYRQILAAIKEISSEVSDGSGGIIHTREGARRVVSAIRLRKYGKEPAQTFADLSQAIAEFYPILELVETEGPEMFTMLERLEHQEKQQREAIEHFKEKAVEERAKADALYVNYKQVEEVLRHVNTVRKKKGWQEAIEAFPDLLIEPDEGTVTVEMAGAEGQRLKVTLDVTKDVNQNATDHYERGKHVRDKIGGAERALEDTRREIEQVKKASAERAAEAQADREAGRKRRARKRFWFESNRWFVSSDGNLIIGGRDAQGNRKVVKRYLKEGDRYAHADIHGAPSIVIKASDVSGDTLEITEATLVEACHYAVCFSKAWSARIGSGEAYWVLPEQVSTTPQSGEFLPKGGFIIRGKRNLVRNLDLRLGIGKIELDGVELVMCSPVSAMEARTGDFYLVVPSKAKKSDAANRLAKEFDVLVEEVEAALPPGGLDIIER